MYSKHYKHYTEARDASWRTHIYLKIKSLPVDLNATADYYNIEIVRYSKCTITQILEPNAKSGDGFITKINGQKAIFLNDVIKTRGRRRFTVGHELGHGVLNHPLENIVFRNSETDSTTNPIEMQANVYSRDIAPACVLDGLGVKTVNE